MTNVDGGRCPPYRPYDFIFSLCLRASTLGVISYPATSSYALLLINILNSPCAGLCTGSDNPLTDPDKEQIDSSLLGTWFWKDENESGYIHIGLDEKSKLLRIIMAEFDRDGELEASEFSGHASSLQGNNYLNLRWVRQEQAENAGYMFIKYTVNSDSLGIAFMNGGVVKEAIKAGSLKGKVNEDSLFSSVQITEGQRKLRKFILRNDKALFPEMKYMPKLKLPNQSFRQTPNGST